jgi:hypothetical protein
MIDDERAGPVNIAYDRAQQDQMVDGPQLPVGSTDVPAKLPPGSFTGYTDVSEDESQHNLLAGQR